MKVEGGEMRGRRGGAGKERERVAPRGHSCPSCDSQEGVGVWVPRMQYGSRAREASARAKEAARQRKGGHAVQTADSGMGEKMVTMTRRQCEGEGDRGAGGTEGRGDGSTGRDGGRPRREPFTWDCEEGVDRADRVGKGAEVSKSAGGARSQGREH
ncbi:hypothetical protein EDB86DRAFT_3219036 [Lactarius hatsudake]|nr:hypothetical protein EDB86DRAFT_3219036 [Lactarius hatsudake]